MFLWFLFLSKKYRCYLSKTYTIPVAFMLFFEFFCILGQQDVWSFTSCIMVVRQSPVFLWQHLLRVSCLTFLQQRLWMFYFQLWYKFFFSSITLNNTLFASSFSSVSIESWKQVKWISNLSLKLFNVHIFHASSMMILYFSFLTWKRWYLK